MTTRPHLTTCGRRRPEFARLTNPESRPINRTCPKLSGSDPDGSSIARFGGPSRGLPPEFLEKTKPTELTLFDVIENIRLMATKTVTELIDDLDGKPADETVSFGLDGVQYEIDLATDNAEALREALAAFAGAARRTGGRRGAPVRVATDVDTKAVRAWAASNGVEVSTRGRIPAHVVEQYRAAGN